MRHPKLAQMKRYKYVHLCPVEKFMPPFVEFIDKQFGLNDHLFLANGLKDPALFKNCPNVRPFGKLKEILFALWNLNRANIIILHSLFSIKVVFILWLQPWLLPRCRWVIWGGDLYMHNDLQKKWWGRWWDLIPKQAISRIGGLITHIEGDVRYSRKWYGASGKWHECFMYPSNLYYEKPNQMAAHDGINILVGNSATESNNHKEVLSKIEQLKRDDVVVYCPLSYGDQSYAQAVSDYGKSLFGDNFIALREFMPLSKYNDLLGGIDIAIFNHRRQQGMGNTTTLLGMGKKVYMKKDVTPYSMFKNLGIQIYSVEDLNLDLISEDVARANRAAVMDYFSEDRLKEQWEAIYE